MYEIGISNQQEHVQIDEAFLRGVAERTLAEEGVATAEISVAIVDNATIHDLNRRYLEHDFETDVLSFLLESSPEPGFAPGAPGPRGAGRRIEGEIILSGEMAARRAGEFLWSPHDETVLYLVHGLLHLVGYDDLTEAERRIMREREGAILSLWNLRPGLPDAERHRPRDREQGHRSRLDRVSGADP
jgi:probable rRNA maturation factor